MSGRKVPTHMIDTAVLVVDAPMKEGHRNARRRVVARAQKTPVRRAWKTPSKRRLNRLSPGLSTVSGIQATLTSLSRRKVSLLLYHSRAGTKTRYVDVQSFAPLPLPS